jgi:hypothetical protein
MKALDYLKPVVLLVAVLVLCSAVASAQPTVTVGISGLDNPRGLAFGPEGALYVVEAGRGGGGPCVMLRGASQCYGPSGALTRLWRGAKELADVLSERNSPPRECMARRHG